MKTLALALILSLTVSGFAVEPEQDADAFIQFWSDHMEHAREMRERKEADKRKANILAGLISAFGAACLYEYRRWKKRHADWITVKSWLPQPANSQVEIMHDGYPHWSSDMPTPCCQAGFRVQRIPVARAQQPKGYQIGVSCKKCGRMIRRLYRQAPPPE